MFLAIHSEVMDVRGWQVFKAMTKQGVMPNEVTYATAIVACWKGNMWRQGVELLNLMKYNNFPLNMITVSMVIDTCERNKQCDLAVSGEGEEQRKVGGICMGPNSLLLVLPGLSCLLMGNSRTSSTQAWLAQSVRKTTIPPMLIVLAWWWTCMATASV